MAMAVTQARDATQRGLDYSVSDKDSMSIADIERWLMEVRDQPNWRRECDIDADYYDGHQLSHEVLEKMREKGFPPIYENLCQPTLNAVLGMEAKSRTDWTVKPDHDRWEDVSMALAAKMKEAERESKADKACSDAYAGQAKTGVAWVEVSKEIIPSRYPYRVKYVHRREIAWDWRSKEPDLSDARYLIRRQWFDEDVLVAMFPKHRTLINAIGTGFNAWWDNLINQQNTDLAQSYTTARASTIEEYEFRDYLRRRLCLYEIWYRVWKNTAMIRSPEGKWVEYDKKNPVHVQAVAQKLVQVQFLPVPKMRLSFWIGPHRLIDMPTPYQHQNFPYVPFFGYREDRTGAPYGLIRNMRPQQDEVNARKQKMMWLLSAKRVITDGDAVKDHRRAKDEVARADAYIVLDENRKPSSKFEVDDNIQLSDQQFKVYEAAKGSLQDVAGVYQALLGKSGAAESGIAINQLIEQGSTTLAEINDNYRHARRMVGELLLELVKEDLGNGTTVMVGDGTQRREVTLNEPAEDEFGPYLRNDVKRAGCKVVLEDIPSTPTYRAQQFAHLAEVTKTLPDDIKAIITDFIIEATDLPNRKQIADRIRKKLGIDSGKPPSTPEEKAAAEQQKAEQMRQQRLQQRAQEAEVGNLEAKAEETRAKAAKLAAEVPQQGMVSEEEARAMVEAAVQDAQAQIADLQTQIKKLDDLVAKSTDAKQQAVAEVARVNQQAKISGIVAKLEQRIAALALQIKQQERPKPTKQSEGVPA